MSIACIIAGYIVGSIPFAWLVARQLGTEDLRNAGSGNLGAANVWRTSGASAGLLVAALDIAKGVASVLVAERFAAGDAVPAAAGAAAIIGHMYPVWLRLRGGKGVATACGVFAVLTPAAALLAVGIFAVGVLTTKYVSVGSVLGSVALPLAAYGLGSSQPAVNAALGVSALVVFRHRSNLVRVLEGTERRIGVRA